MTVTVLPPGTCASHLPACDVTTRGGVFRPLSPMLLGPVPLYGGLWSRTMENAWQYAKVHSQYEHGGYWPWALAGWDNPRGVRYPMGKGARPLFSQWAGDQLDYITARRRIYIPLYAQAVRFSQLNLFLALREQVCNPGDGVITDFDAYDHQVLGYTWDDVMNDPERKMGHGFVLAMMIEGIL